MTKSEAEIGPPLTDIALREEPFKSPTEMTPRQREAIQNEVEARWPKRNAWPR